MKITVYLDADYRCHVDPAQGRTPYETDFFESREELIEKYRIVPAGESWTRLDGVLFTGEMIAPWSEGDNPVETLLADIEEALNG